MSEIIHTSEVTITRSIAEIILSHKMPEWKKWLLRELIPEELWDAPPQTIAKLAKGAVIGKMVMYANVLDTDA